MPRLLLALLFLGCSRAPHQVPAACSDGVRPEARQELRCQAHRAARVCSMWSETSEEERIRSTGCLRLWLLAMETQDPVITKLASQFVIRRNCF